MGRSTFLYTLRLSLSVVVFYIAHGLSLAQTSTTIVDSLRPAYKEAYRGIRIQTGRTWSNIESIKKVITPVGEGDAIKLIQTLPGISTGAEGSSAFYVRGGNLGNNLLSIDGVNIYGMSHLLGITSVVPSDMIGEMDFQIGGFDADRGATMSSFIGLKSVLPKTDAWHFSEMVSPFLESVSATGPISKRTGVVFTGRYSPAGLFYKSMRGLLSSEEGLHDLSTNVYDIYAKVYHRTREGDEIAASLFNSMDHYAIKFGKSSDRYEIEWLNCFGLVRYTRHYSESTRTEYGISYNKYESSQSSDVTYNHVLNNLRLRSSLKEFMADGKILFTGNNFSYQTGVQLRYTGFNPGSSSLSSRWVNQHYFGLTTVLWGQFEYRNPEILYLKMSSRFNAYKSDSSFMNADRTYYEPEVSFLGELNVSERIKFTATLDRTVQFYHTLEGLPLGWSMDLIVPSDFTAPAESAYQIYLGSSASYEGHRITTGGYYKTMDNIVYYTNAAALFSSAIIGWKDNIAIGKGTSYGVETLYEYSGHRLSSRIAYTLSKTDRTFENINGGNPFPSKFDRRHILNLSVEYNLENNRKVNQGFTSAFTFQSGHWESFKEYSYPSVSLDGEDFMIPYFNTQPNNLHMPNYLRLDVGYFRNWKNTSGKTSYNFKTGVYNFLNKHNPFILMYDETEGWMELSIMPFLPNISFTIEF